MPPDPRTILSPHCGERIRREERGFASTGFKGDSPALNPYPCNPPFFFVVFNRSSTGFFLA
ncbi:MAG: hypothetical protein HY401_04330 [Elusimicrobia bacterium]|nr:hypothetical protein [Elusimicrobiota bacterium]